MRNCYHGVPRIPACSDGQGYAQLFRCTRVVGTYGCCSPFCAAFVDHANSKAVICKVSRCFRVSHIFLIPVGAL